MKNLKKKINRALIVGSEFFSSVLRYDRSRIFCFRADSRHTDIIPMKDFEDALSKYKHSLLDGTIDEFFQLHKDSTLELIETANKVSSAIPSTYWEYDRLAKMYVASLLPGNISNEEFETMKRNVETFTKNALLGVLGYENSRKGRREFERKKERLKKRLEKTYNFNYGKKKELLLNMTRNADLFPSKRKILKESAPDKFFIREEIEKILERYGQEIFMRFYETENFE